MHLIAGERMHCPILMVGGAAPKGEGPEGLPLCQGDVGVKLPGRSGKCLKLQETAIT